MLTYSFAYVPSTLPLTHNSNVHSFTQPTATELNYLHTYPPISSSASQTHALPAMKELVWDLGTLEDTIKWGMEVGGGGTWASLRSGCWA